MRGVLVMAGREIRAGLRNRWVVAATGVLAVLALVLAFLGSAPAGEVGADALTVNVVSLSSLSIYLLPLIALMLSYDAIVGEAENGTLLLLLAYPVSRWQVLAGKLIGHAAILAFATVVGFGLAGAAIAATGEVDAQGVYAFALLIGSSVLLGWVFVGVGYLLSAVVRERSTAAGLAIAVWLLLVVLYDLALLGGLAVTGGSGLIGRLVPALLLLNPADAYRLLNLAGLPQVAAFSGLAAAGRGVAAWAPPVALLAWVAVPVAAAWLVFRRRAL
ncbi:putative ABC transporter permease protein NosY [wastewater metagenome]|uniref:Putative ABC transporter permease protein NosY n=2 Tax=unclassified sequences TaxID=12908 RepID=A0A5B8RCK7_9ZZZZ|nr:ABC transporter permease subunit [Arhodomonas sp. KWT]QEA04505.1 putative ABC transporter permease protein NosY [uncultured organism]